MFGARAVDPILAAVMCDRINRPDIWPQSLRSKHHPASCKQRAVHIWVPAFAGTTRECALLRRCIPAGMTDIARRVAEPFDHDRGEVLCLAGDAGAGSYRVTILMLEVRRRVARLQRAGGIHHSLSEMHDAKIGRA